MFDSGTINKYSTTANTYDDNGNLYDDTIYKYFYDYRNRLMKITKSSNTSFVYVENKYDVFGNRISKNVDTDDDGTVDTIEFD